MAQAHGDRLTAVDASFLAQEGQTSHMHIGAVDDLRGPAAGVRRLRRPRPRAAAPRPPLPPEARGPAARDRPAAVGRRPELQPRVPPAPHGAARARLARSSCARSRRGSTPSGSTAPSRCGSSGSSQGLEQNRFALISKTHHALVDGVAGVDLAPCSSTSSRCRTPAPHEGEPWVPAARAERRRARRPRRPRAGRAAVLASPAARSARRRGRAASLHVAREAVEGVAEVAWAGLNPAPDTPLNVPIGPHRRLVIDPQRAGATSSASRTRSAAPSTTSC